MTTLTNRRDSYIRWSWRPRYSLTFLFDDLLEIEDLGGVRRRVEVTVGDGHVPLAPVLDERHARRLVRLGQSHQHVLVDLQPEIECGGLNVQDLY